MQSHRPGALLLFALAMLLSACSGDKDNAGTISGPRFLMASQQGLARVNLDGARQTLLTFDDGSYPLDPAPSPDGKRLAYVRQPPARQLPDGTVDFGSDLYVAAPDGGKSRQLVKHARVAEFVRAPAWISDNELIFTVRGPDASGFADFRLERLNVDTGERSRYLDFAVDAAVSRDGRQIAFIEVDVATREETLTVASIDLSARTPIAGAANHLSLFTALAFSPDGSRLAFAAVDLSSPDPAAGGTLAGVGIYAAHPFAQDVWLANVDGTGLRRLGEIAENQPSLTWSDDGATIYALGPSSMWRIDSVTGEAAPIGPGVPLGQIVWDPGN